MSKLIRGLSLPQAIAINAIDMVGIGPFIALPFIMGAMQGPAAIFAWLLGAVLALADGSVWAELGAQWPEAGGSYVFLRKLYNDTGAGKLMSFLYTWQTVIQGPLVVASGAIGFAQYLTYLVPLNMWQQKAVSGSLVIIITALLYRQITSIGKISLLFGLIVFGTMIWIIAAGFMHFSTAGFTGFSLAGITPHNLGAAFTKVIYCYLGYYNVCHLGAEIKNPERNIPRSIFISIGIIAAFYVLMQIAVLAVLPWQQAKESPFIISLFFERVYGPFAAQMATGLILLIAVSSLFAVLLGYSRVPYAAASDNNFFSVFAKLHPVKSFPYISLLTLAALAFVFSLLFKMQQIITAIIVMRVLVQFIAQISGLIMFHKKHPEQVFPFRMWLYPLPAVMAIGAWLFIFLCALPAFMLGAAGIIVLGVLLFYMPVYFPVKKS